VLDVIQSPDMLSASGQSEKSTAYLCFESPASGFSGQLLYHLDLRFSVCSEAILLDVIPVHQLFDRADVYNAIVEMARKLGQVLPLDIKRVSPIGIEYSWRMKGRTIQR
jgi:hypothetical protein